MISRLKILIVSPEVQPFAKTGGLGDISQALPVALKKMGHDVRVIMPKYGSVDWSENACRKLDLPPMAIPIGSEMVQGNLYEASLDNALPIYFVECGLYFDRKNLYGEDGREYPDNAERFIFFSRAALEACKSLEFQPDIIHCGDWQTGLICAYLKSIYAQDPFFKKTASVFSIHNLGFQGNYPSALFPLTGLPPELFTMHGVEFYGAFSMLKAGLVYADAIATVSQTYRREIMNPENGCGMDGVLRSRKKDFYGILNGANYAEWDPRHDALIAKKYHPGAMQGKSVCKNALRKTTGLTIKKTQPLICMVTRLSQQKGLDLVMKGFDELLAGGAAFILLGSGEPVYEKFFLRQSQRYPQKFFCKIGFNEELAHQIIAGSDILLMPSEYEPCGLTQMHAMKYGTAPLVRSIGGLRETVKAFDLKTKKGSGFKFLPLELKYFLKSFRKAESVFKDQNLWRQLVANCMAENFDWDKAAGHYARIYRKALRNRLA